MGNSTLSLYWVTWVKRLLGLRTSLLGRENPHRGPTLLVASCSSGVHSWFAFVSIFLVLPLAFLLFLYACFCPQCLMVIGILEALNKKLLWLSFQVLLVCFHSGANSVRGRKWCHCQIVLEPLGNDTENEKYFQLNLTYIWNLTQKGQRFKYKILNHKNSRRRHRTFFWSVVGQGVCRHDAQSLSVKEKRGLHQSEYFFVCEWYY